MPNHNHPPHRKHGDDCPGELVDPVFETMGEDDQHSPSPPAPTPTPTPTPTPRVPVTGE